ncbi:MAG: universal stress protein [Planctomycetes bacterium]|jgi:nucleotide-binding universal stress UspA family protein|nr:universal stress protein [Planctomycetota bacterium]
MPERVVRRMLAFVEFADRGDPDVTWAIRLARQLGAELILFSVIDRPAMVSLIGTHRAAMAERGATLTATLVADAKRILQRLVDAAASNGVVARGHAIVSEEVPEQILKEAIVQQVDLIVIRPSGRQGFLQHLMRSTVEEILSAAPCGVLVAQPK